MIYIPNEANDPRINLAIEHYLFKNKKFTEPTLLFYINQPSIIIGKYQNTIEEVNQQYVDEQGIAVVRRLTGGGAVYHDEGNLNFSFIMPYDEHSVRNFAKFTQPIIKALHDFGIPQAELKGRNDLVINDQKFSGNAMFAAKDKILAHGTILFNSNIGEVVNALKVKPDKIASKGIKSIRSRVTNVKPFLPEEKQHLTTEEFRDQLLLHIFDATSYDEIKTYELTEEDYAEIMKISETYYQNWDWNYGQSPAFSIERQQRFPIGSIELKFNVDQGVIQAIKIYGDFFGNGAVADIETLLIGQKYRRDHLQQVLAELDLNHYFGQITLDEFLDLLC